MNKNCLKCNSSCEKCSDRTCFGCKHMKGAADRKFMDAALENRRRGVGILHPFDTYVCRCAKNILLRDNGEIHNFPIGSSQWARGLNNGYSKWDLGKTCSEFE